VIANAGASLGGKHTMHQEPFALPAWASEVDEAQVKVACDL
jgi:hypothetical protein